MDGQQKINVLVVSQERDVRGRYVDELLSAGYMAHEVTPDQAEAFARASRFDVAVLETPLDAAGLDVAERLAAMRPRPRLIVVTTRVRNGAPLEFLFDAYLLRPCLGSAVVDAVRNVRIPPATQDLLIVARERIGIHDVLLRFGDAAGSVEVRLDRRQGDRRRTSRRSGGARRGGTALARQERRRAERRDFDVHDQLRLNGWAFIAALNRSW